MRKESSAQTHTIAFFRVKNNSQANGRPSKQEKQNRPFVQKPPAQPEVEDLLLDKILKDRVIYGNTNITNTWLDDFFVHRPGIFSVDLDRLVVSADSQKNLFEDFVKQQNNEEFLNTVETIFVEIFVQRQNTFTPFNKLVRTGNVGALEAFAFFNIWLSKYLKVKIVAFLFDCLLVFLYVIWKSGGSIEAIDAFFRENHSFARSDDLVKEVEALFYTIYGQARMTYLGFETVIQYFHEYFKGINPMEGD